MEKLLYKVENQPKLKKLLFVAMNLCVAINAVGFLFLMIWHMEKNQIVYAMATLIASSVGFVMVTVARMLINSRRPYQVYSFYSIDPHKKLGLSFPSRHAYSAWVIAALAYMLSPWLAVGLMLVALVICACRVLLGIHFIKDVVVGAAIGLIFGAVGSFAGLYVAQGLLNG